MRLASVWVVLRLSEESRANVGEIDLLGPTAPFICSVAGEDLLDEGHQRSVGVHALPAAVDDDSRGRCGRSSNAPWPAAAGLS